MMCVARRRSETEHSTAYMVARFAMGTYKMRGLFLPLLFLPFLLCPALAQQSPWEIEAESASTHVLLFADSVEIKTSAGLTLWWRWPMSVPFTLEYEAMVCQRDSTDRLSDLNCFWLATDPTVPDGSPLQRIGERNGVFAQAATLRLYYLGYGGNWNTTTRFRRYHARPQPPLLREYTDSAHLLRPNHWYRIRIEATAQRTRYYIDGELLVDYADPEPLQRGWFGFRTTWSHCLLRHFRVR